MQNTRSNMKKWRSIAVIIVMVCLMIGQSGCTGIFDSTKSEVRIAKKVLKEKYNEDFEIITLGGRWGTLTNDTFTVKCYPVSDPDCIFKAEIQKEGHYVFDEYVSTRVCKRLKTEIEEMMNGVQVSAYIEALPSSNDGTDSNFYPIVGRDTTIGYESIYYLTQEQYDDAVIGGKVRISLKGK